MIVALVLGAIVSAAGATALAGAERYTRAARDASAARRTLREAEAVLASELRAAAADSLRVRGDTAVDFPGLVGVSVACASSGTLLVLPPDVAAGGYPYSSWRASPEAGDIVAVFDTAAGGVWHVATVDTVSSRVDGAGCTPSSGLISQADSAARHAATRIVLRSAFTWGSVRIGSPVRVVRGARYALTRSAEGGWSLSYRRCDAASCGTAQPVAGSLGAPDVPGLRFTAPAGTGQVEVALRAPAVFGAGSVSDTFRITLRNRAVGVP
jgi:hypothetical protein